MGSEVQKDASTTSNDLDLLKKMEDEHLRLQRQVRIIQADRTNSNMGVHPLFREQDHLLRTLKKEYINLAKDLKIARSGAHKKKDRKMRKDLKKALLLRQKTEQDCEGGEFLMEQLDDLIKLNSKHNLRLRSLAEIGRGQLNERRVQSELRLASTENKLETAMIRYNSISFETKRIRGEIEHMLKDRALFNQAWEKMIKVLTKGKKYLREMFESSSVAYDQRDEWCGKLRSLQVKGNIEQMTQVQEMRDIQNHYDHEMKLYQFLSKKGRIRINRKEEQRAVEKTIKENEEIVTEIKKQRKILDEIDNYTEESDISKVIDNFNAMEVENFSMFRLLCEIAAENEILGNEVKMIRRDIVDRRDWNENHDARLDKKLEEVKKNFEQQKKRTEKMKNKINDKDAMLNNTMDKLNEIFKTLNCSLEPFQNLLGYKGPSLHHLNLTFYLITERIKSVVQTVFYYEHHYFSKKQDKGLLSSRLKKYTVHVEPPVTWTAPPVNIYVPADPCPNCIEARWMSRLSESAALPLSRAGVLQAVCELAGEVAYERSDRIHALVDCRLPRSRLILAKRYQ